MTQSPSRPWSVGSPILLLQTSPSKQDLRAVQEALPDLRVVVLKVALNPVPTKRSHRALMRLRHGGKRLPRRDAKAEVRLRRALDKAPNVATVLALESNAQRIALGVLRKRTDVVAFGGIDHLKRAVAHPAAIDLCERTSRLVDFRHTYEAISDAAAVPSAAAGLARLVVGANNEYSVADDLATAVGKAGSASAVSVSIDGDGSPADFMLSVADWHTPEIREEIAETVGEATHLLLTDRRLADLASNQGCSIARVLPWGSPADPDARFSPDPRKTSEETRWLPVSLPTGLFAPRSPIDAEVVRVLLVREPVVSRTVALKLNAVCRADMVRLIDLESVDSPIRLQVAASCDVVLDLRINPMPDAVVLAGLAGGATLISAFEDWTGPSPAPPHLVRGLDPIATLASATSNPGELKAPNDAGVSYATEYHDGRKTAQTLASFLGEGPK